MKKILFGMSAMAMLFATSCQDDVVLSGSDATVAFNISAGDITRAFSDGTTVNELHYAIYDGNKLLTALSGTEEVNQGHASLSVDLKTGKTYKAIFWADYNDKDPNTADPYQVVFTDGSATMTVNYDGAVSNDETRDAFYTVQEIKVDGNATVNVKLTRPFAQLNIGASDFGLAANANYVPQTSYVKVPVYTTLNLTTGEVGEDNPSVKTFAYATIPSQDEVFPVDNDKYDYLAMNYLLVGENETVDIEFGHSALDAQSVDFSNLENSRKVGSVPLKRNYRTNIYGKLLTSEVDVNVEIEPEYNGALTADDLQLAAAFGGEVTLTEDVVLTTPLNVQANMTLNLGGKTLTGAVNVADDVQVTVNNGKIVNTNKEVSGITSNGDLILNDVTIESARHAIRVESGKVVINGGLYKVDPISKSTLHALNVGDNGTTAEVIIKGGQFIGPKGTSADSGSAVNVRSGSTVAIEGGDFSGGKTKTLSGTGITISGGSFDQNPTAFVADGYKVVEKNSKYYVVPKEADAVATTTEELAAALANGNVVAVAAGEYKFPAADSFKASQKTLVCAEGTVFTGNSKLNINGATVIGATFSNPSGNAVAGNINGTFKNCTFEGSNALSYCYAGETVVFENCEFSGSTYGVHFDGGDNKEITFKKCKLSGFNAFAAALKMVTFEKCTFVGNGKSGYNGANLWGSAKMIACEFKFDGTTANEWIDCIGTDKTYEFTNCTVNGVAYTPDNYQSIENIFSRNNAEVTINGEECQL